MGAMRLARGSANEGDFELLCLYLLKEDWNNSEGPRSKQVLSFYGESNSFRFAPKVGRSRHRTPERWPTLAGLPTNCLDPRIQEADKL